MSRGFNTIRILYCRYAGQLVFFTVIAIILLSVLPIASMKEADVTTTGSGKGYFAHLAAYALLSFLAYSYTLVHPRKNSLVKIALAVFLFSAFLEVVQLLIPYRSFNPYDMLANAMGVLSGIAAGYLFLYQMNLLQTKN